MSDEGTPLFPHGKDRLSFAILWGNRLRDINTQGEEE